jgi:hypothetical protein
MEYLIVRSLGTINNMVALRSDTYRKTLYMLETPKALSTKV